MINPLKRFFERKRTINDINTDELRRAKITLDREEAGLIARIEDIDTQKGALFAEGRDEASTLKRRILADRIKALDVEGKNLARQLQMLSRQQRIINGFIQIKENQRLLEASGVSELISTIDLDTLRTYVDEASLEGAFQIDKFQEMLGTLEAGSEEMGEGEDDEDVLAIMQAFEEAKLASSENPEMAEKIGRERLDQILNPPTTEPPERGA